MNAMVLCPGCKRHVFSGETACPFCGIGFASTTVATAPTVSPELSRAQRYVVGAAIAASIATAGCSSPTVVHNPDEAGNVTVDVNETQADRQQRESLELARDDNALADEEAARREQQERARREEERRRALEQQQQQWRERERWERGHSCSNGVCPPYGCVFPDETCDIVRV